MEYQIGRAIVSLGSDPELLRNAIPALLGACMPAAHLAVLNMQKLPHRAKLVRVWWPDERRGPFLAEGGAEAIHPGCGGAYISITMAS